MLETDSICAKSCAEMEIGMDKENAIEVKNITKDFLDKMSAGVYLKLKILKSIMIREANLKKRCFSGNVTDMRKDMY